MRQTDNIMKKYTHTLLPGLLGLLMVAGLALPSRAQSETYITYALVDMSYILSRIPEYGEATKQMEATAQGYAEEVKALQDEAAKLYTDYRKELADLSADERMAREMKIVSLEDKAAELQRTYFGPEGSMAKLREERIRPIEDKVYEAIKLYSRKFGIYMVFDRAASVGSIIYADPAADISNDILQILGISQE